MLWGDILTNILSDFFALVIGIVLYWLVFILFKRTQLIKFFGIRNNKKIAIYLSNVNVQEYGSKGIEDTIFSYQGQTLPYEESKAATKLQSLFNYFLPSVFEKPKIIQKLLISDIDANILASPNDQSLFEKTLPLVSIGLPAYNLLSDHIEKTYSLSGKSGYIEIESHIELPLNSESEHKQHLAHDTMSNVGTATPLFPSVTSSASTDSFHMSTILTSPSAINLSEIISDSDGKVDITITKRPIIVIDGVPPYSDTSIGFVQRIYDNNHKQNIFYLAGLSENSTAGCVYFLVSHWKELYKKYNSNTQFLILLKVDEHNNQLSEIIFEK